MSRFQKVVWVVLFSGVLAVLAGVGWAADNMLTVTQDESSMERVIEQYLKDAHQLVLTEKTLENNDLVLVDDEKGGPMPAYSIVVDTESVSKPVDGKIAERSATVQLYTGVKVPPEKLLGVLKAISAFTAKNWFFAAYVDDDSEIALQWNVNVMSQGLHAEYVYDAMVRVNDAWEKLWPLVSAALQ